MKNKFLLLLLIPILGFTQVGTDPDSKAYYSRVYGNLGTVYPGNNTYVIPMSGAINSPSIVVKDAYIMNPHNIGGVVDMQTNPFISWDDPSSKSNSYLSGPTPTIKTTEAYMSEDIKEYVNIEISKLFKKPKNPN